MKFLSSEQPYQYLPTSTDRCPDVTPRFRHVSWRWNVITLRQVIHLSYVYYH